MLCVMLDNACKASLKNLFRVQTTNFSIANREIHPKEWCWLSTTGSLLYFFVQNEPDLLFLALPKLLLQSRRVDNL